MPHVKIVFLALAKKMWPKVTAYAFLGGLSALAAAGFREHIPDDLTKVVDRDTLDSILAILASSMLAVTTFSLSTMVSAYSAATSNVTPRASRLITEDRTTQNALSTFLGTFLYSLVGIIALNMGVYEGGGRFILFAATMVVIVLIVIVLIRWIDRLTELGRVGETSRLVEKATIEAIKIRAARPTLGCNKLDQISSGGWHPRKPVEAGGSGYVLYVDVAALSRIADENGVDIYVHAMPGKYVTRGAFLAATSDETAAKATESVRNSFTISDQRVFDQDPRFGLCVLAEIASRAASAAVNDNGTAIDIITRLHRVLETYARERRQNGQVEYGRVWVPELDAGDLFQDAFNPIARDAAGAYEVHARLQKALVHLAGMGREYHDNARKYSEIALRYAEAELFLEEEKAQLREMARQLP